MPTQMNYGKGGGSYKPGKEADAPISHAQSNFDGGRTTKKAGGRAYYETRPQMNFENTMSIDVKAEKGQGQKSGTGSQDGY